DLGDWHGVLLAWIARSYITETGSRIQVTTRDIGQAYSDHIVSGSSLAHNEREDVTRMCCFDRGWSTRCAMDYEQAAHEVHQTLTKLKGYVAQEPPLHLSE